jgi:hypothetical protein
MARPLLRAAWILVALVATPGWALSFYVVPMNLAAVVLLFAVDFVGSKGRALDAFMLTVFVGMVLAAAFFTFVLDDSEGKRAGIAIASIILASALLVMKCGAVYAQLWQRQQHQGLMTRVPSDVAAPDRHRARPGRDNSVGDGAENSWLIMLLGVGGMVAVFVAVALLLLMVARNIGG